jgi:hypothetical protein
MVRECGLLAIQLELAKESTSGVPIHGLILDRRADILDQRRLPSRCRPASLGSD